MSLWSEVSRNVNASLGVTRLGLWDPALCMVWNCCSETTMLVYFHTSMCACHGRRHHHLDLCLHMQHQVRCKNNFCGTVGQNMCTIVLQMQLVGGPNNKVAPQRHISDVERYLHVLWVLCNPGPASPMRGGRWCLERGLWPDEFSSAPGAKPERKPACGTGQVDCSEFGTHLVDCAKDPLVCTAEGDLAAATKIIKLSAVLNNGTSMAQTPSFQRVLTV